MTNQFDLTVLYNQISVCSTSQIAFPLWSDDHVAQGFAWRHGHVSFGIPDHDGNCMVQVEMTNGLPQDREKAERIILVPMQVDTDGATLATVMDVYSLQIDAGIYQLYFLLFPSERKDSAFRIWIGFEEMPNPTFNILRKSGEMTTDKVLTTSSEPA